MGIIPKQGEPKEPVGVLAVLIVHFIFGLGIVIIGQRTKNPMEFWGGVASFLIVMSVLVLTIISGTGKVPFGYGLFSLATWIYIVSRFVWIFMKKETELKIL